MTRKEMVLRSCFCKQPPCREQGLPGAILDLHQSAFGVFRLSLYCRRLFQVPSEMGSVGIGDISRVFSPEAPFLLPGALQKRNVDDFHVR